MNWESHEKTRREKWKAKYYLLSVVLLLFVTVWPFVVVHNMAGLDWIPGWMTEDACRIKGFVYYSGPICDFVMKPFHVALSLLITPLYYMMKYVFHPVFIAIFAPVDRHGNPIKYDL